MEVLKIEFVRRFYRKGRALLAFVGFAVLLVIAALVIAPHYIYGRLTDETYVGYVRFEQVGYREFDAFLSLANGACTMDKFRIHGEQWRLEARFLRWKSWAKLLGADPLYRLDRFSGRYVNVEDEKNEKRSAFDVAPEVVIDPFDWSSEILGVDTVNGDSVYQDMEHGKGYDILTSGDGLFARPREVINPDPDTILIDRGCDTEDRWIVRVLIGVNNLF